MRTAFILLVLTGAILAGGADHAAKLLAKGDHEAAAAAARKLTKKDVTNVDAWLVLADALTAMGEPGDGWEVVEQAMEANPKDARLSIKLGDIFMKLAEIEQATSRDGTAIRNYYLDAERMYSEAADKDPKSADALYGQAHVNFWLGQEDTKAKARAILSDCLRLDKDHGRAHALQGYMFYIDKQYPQAQTKYEIALKLDDSDPLTYVRYGHTFFAQGKYDDAKNAYIAALKRHPNSAVPIQSGLYHLANREAKRKSWLNLQPYLVEASKIAPQSAPVWYYLGYCRFTNEKFRQALDAYKMADAKAPGNATYLFQVGYCHEKLGKGDKALKQYRKALEVQADHPDATMRFYTLAIAQASDIDAAEKLFEELVKLAPNTDYVHNDYGLILRNWAERRGATSATPPKEAARRIKRSGVIYEIAATLRPDDPQYQSDTGLLFEYYPINFDPEKAKAYFTRALSISDFAYRDAFDGLNRVCRKTNDWATLKDYAGRVIESLEDGKIAIAPVGASAPKELPNETPGMLARARAAKAFAEKNLPS